MIVSVISRKIALDILLSQQKTHTSILFVIQHVRMRIKIEIEIYLSSIDSLQ